jgi:hypothetical protein
VDEFVWNCKESEQVFKIVFCELKKSIMYKAKKRKYAKRAEPVSENSELKFHDTEISGAVGNTITGSALCCSPLGICAPGNGTGQSERIGNKIRMTKVQVQLAFEHSGAFDNTVVRPNILNCALVWDKQTNNTNFTGKENSVYDDSLSHDYLPTRELEKSSRFKVLAFEQITMRPQAASFVSGVGFYYGQDSQIVRFDCQVDIPILFSDSLYTDARDIVDNSLGIMVWARHNSSSCDNINCNAKCRIRFYDE